MVRHVVPVEDLWYCKKKCHRRWFGWNFPCLFVGTKIQKSNEHCHTRLRYSPRFPLDSFYSSSPILHILRKQNENSSASIWELASATCWYTTLNVIFCTQKKKVIQLNAIVWIYPLPGSQSPPRMTFRDIPTQTFSPLVSWVGGLGESSKLRYPATFLGRWKGVKWVP